MIPNFFPNFPNFPNFYPKPRKLRADPLSETNGCDEAADSRFERTADPGGSRVRTVAGGGRSCNNAPRINIFRTASHRMVSYLVPRGFASLVHTCGAPSELCT